ncbi:hypothetical protein RchiOBHm_Chr1g0367991 [Rosa chinensis]|uniref:Uncharacterized protein n=1 Tax=Rosa chinensis TaxID=74649 RepID=A0A2P6SKP0_ROSCH|nr:hypothetical protein RchiOBHm_Chr1g0367991 [Rosa chinensis]
MVKKLCNLALLRKRLLNCMISWFLGSFIKALRGNLSKHVVTLIWGYILCMSKVRCDA